MYSPTMIVETYRIFVSNNLNFEALLNTRSDCPIITISKTIKIDFNYHARFDGQFQSYFKQTNRFNKNIEIRVGM